MSGMEDSLEFMKFNKGIIKISIAAKAHHEIEIFEPHLLQVIDLAGPKESLLISDIEFSPQFGHFCIFKLEFVIISFVRYTLNILFLM